MSLGLVSPLPLLLLCPLPQLPLSVPPLVVLLLQPLSLRLVLRPLLPLLLLVPLLLPLRICPPCLAGPMVHVHPPCSFVPPALAHTPLHLPALIRHALWCFVMLSGVWSCSPVFVRAPWYLFIPICGISGWSVLVHSYVRARWRSFVLFCICSCSPVLIRDGQPSFIVFRAGLPSSMLVCAYAHPPSCWAPPSCAPALLFVTYLL